MTRRSAGILLFRQAGSGPEVLLVHPGGPFWTNRDEGAWSIPKGEYGEGEDALAAAKRELEEEIGLRLEGRLLALGNFRQSRAKMIDVWASETDFEPAMLRSNTFALEWPPKSGRVQEFPEVDRVAWFGPEEAARKILKGQVPVLAAFLAKLAGETASASAARR